MPCEFASVFFLWEGGGKGLAIDIKSREVQLTV